MDRLTYDCEDQDTGKLTVLWFILLWRYLGFMV